LEREAQLKAQGDPKIAPAYSKEEIAANLARKKNEERTVEKFKDLETLKKEKEQVINSLVAERCLSATELKFCELLKKNRGPLDYHEGVYINLQTIYISSLADVSLKTFNSELPYTDDDKEKVVEYVTRIWGRRKNLVDFRRTYLLEKLKPFEQGRFLALFELMRNSYDQLMNQHEFLDNIVFVILGEKDKKIEYLGHIKMSKSFYLEMKTINFDLALKYVGHSGINHLIKEHIPYFDLPFDEEAIALEEMPSSTNPSSDTSSDKAKDSGTGPKKNAGLEALSN